MSDFKPPLRFSSWTILVAEFLIARGDKLPTGMSQELLPEIKVLRTRLILEEFAELVMAMHEHDRIGSLDAICDLLYVVIGTAVAMGFGPILDDAFREVHRSNMTKDFPAVGSEEKSGKKGVRYTPPNLEAIIINYETGRPEK